LVILGATGSIGRSTADVIEGAPGAFQVEAIAGGRDGAGLARMAIRLGARFAAVWDKAAYDDLKAGLAGTNIRAGAGVAAVTEAALHDADLVVGAISGAAGVEPTHAALLAGRQVALANKECLVCAGDLFMKTAAAQGTRLLPMDSEHNAIFQALGTSRVDEVEEMILTASGGPFRTWDAARIAAAKPEEALNHPNWSMGPKVTIDSASLMNKGLELIEAHHIFGIPAKKLGVLVHPQSIVHGLVTFGDGAVVAGLACPDMKVPIAHCLGYPDRVATAARRLDLAAIGSLTFEKPDLERFPALRVAMSALEQGGAMPTVLNAANEVAVAAFLDRKISFMEIARLVEACCLAAARETNGRAPASVAEALEIDHMSRERARSLLN
jgi:1-deoxy-D-xylulose-5-phosphate reductoisomerase